MAELEVDLIRSPGRKPEPDSEGDAARNDRGGDGYLSDSQRSLIGDEFGTNESSRLIASQEGQTLVTQLDTSLPQPADPDPGPVPGPTDTGSKRAASLSVNGGATSSLPGSPPPPPPVCKSPGARTETTRLSSTPSVCTGGSYKSAVSQIPASASDDCCVHCILACLFCEFLTFCDLLLDCASCGDGGEACCCWGVGEACGGAEEGSPCSLDCGVLSDCCESSDCLEICLECCSICFPT